jgi:hypothetical protein
VRHATFVLVAMLAACSDLQDFRATWQGPRVGSAAVLHVGVADKADATLTLDAVDKHGMHGTIAIDGLVPPTDITSIDGAEADVLAGISFSGAPLRVYLAFVDVPDGAGQAFALVALYDDHRIEVRILRGGSIPLYAIFTLTEA